MQCLNDGDDNPHSSGSSRFYNLHQEKRYVARLRPDGAASRTSNFATLLFENERVRVFDFRLPPGRSATIVHRHPTIRWQVDTGRHRLVSSRGENVEDEDGERLGEPPAAAAEEEELVADRRVFYVESGTKWDLTNSATESAASVLLSASATSSLTAGLGDVYRQIVFELLSETPKYDEGQVRALFAKARYSTDVGTALLFENRLCRVWDFYLEPARGGGEDTVHHHCLDYVFINVAPSRLLGLHPVSLSLNDLLFDSVSEDNDVTWNYIPEDAALDPKYAHGGKNGYEDRPMREYLVELK